MINIGESSKQTTLTVKSSAWPSPQDYNESVQNPGFSFADPELAGAEAELNGIGLPKPASGNFASVYRLYSDQREWAVRCFLQPLADQEQRYAALSKKIESINVSYLAAFEYVSSGIRVHNDWFPIIKMEWVRGETLLQYIQNNLSEPEVLNRLAESFKQVVLSLQANGIAHGDLQHGNIIVQSDGGVRLVDYDGFFVEELAGRMSNELGHRNYQHPLRTAQDFNASIDNFSAWMIWISIKALADDPSLWEKVHAGDECLLFRRHDFVQPQYSRRFHVLEMHHSEETRLHARFLRSLLSRRLDEIPALQSCIELPQNLPPLMAVIEPVNSKVTESKVASLPEETELEKEYEEYLSKASQYDMAAHRINNLLSRIAFLDQPTSSFTVILVLAVCMMIYQVLVFQSFTSPAHQSSQSNFAGTRSFGTRSRNHAPEVSTDKLLENARNLMRQNNYYDAASVLQDVLSADSRTPFLFGENKAEVLEDLGKCQSYLEEGDFGAGYFARAARHYLESESYKVSALTCYWLEGNAAYRAKQYDLAFDAYLKVFTPEYIKRMANRSGTAKCAVKSALAVFEDSADKSTSKLRQLWDKFTACRDTANLNCVLLAGINESADNLMKQGSATDLESSQRLFELERDLAGSSPAYSLFRTAAENHLQMVDELKDPSDPPVK